MSNENETLPEEDDREQGGDAIVVPKGHRGPLVGFGRVVTASERGCMLKHNSYFEGRVQSIGFERKERRQTVGVVAAGEFHFTTDGPERISIVSGEILARFAGRP